MNEIEKLLQEMAEHIHDVITVSLVGQDGLIIAEYVNKETVGTMDTEFTAATITTVMLKITDVVSGVNLGKMVDNLLSTEDGHFLTKYIGDGSAFLSIVAKRGANLGAMRYVSKVYGQKLWELLPH